MVIKSLNLNVIVQENDLFKPLIINLDCMTDHPYGTFNIGEKYRIYSTNILHCNELSENVKFIFKYLSNFTLFNDSYFAKYLMKSNIFSFSLDVSWNYLKASGYMHSNLNSGVITESFQYSRNSPGKIITRKYPINNYNSDLTSDVVDALHMYNDIIYLDLEPESQTSNYDFWEASGYYYIAKFISNIITGDDDKSKRFILNFMYVMGYNFNDIRPTLDVDMFDVSEDGITYTPITDLHIDISTCLILCGLLYFCFATPRLCIISSNGEFFRRNPKALKVLSLSISDIESYNISCSQFIISTNIQNYTGQYYSNKINVCGNTAAV